MPQSFIVLKTNLQVAAVKVTLHQQISICSVYIPPDEEMNGTELQEITNQLSIYFILIVDFNCHSTPSGDCKNTNQKGKNMESFIENNNLCIFNDKSPTFICPFSGNQSAIDLSLCDSSMFLDFSWKVLPDTYGSDHYPICLQNSEQTDEKSQWWNLNKANWEEYQKLSSEKLKEGSGITSITQFTETLISIAKKGIPKSKIKKELK